MSGDLKILFLPKWYPSRVHELNGSFIRRHALAVALKHKVAVLYICADPAMKDRIYDTEFEVDAGIPTVRVFYNNSIRVIPVFFTAIKFYRYLRSCSMGIKIINKEFGRWDISHIHVLARTFLIAFFYKLFYKIPFIVSEHWSGYLTEDNTYKGFLKKMLTKIAVRNASAVTTVSERLKEAMLSHGLANTYVIIPNVVDTELFYSEKRSASARYILLHVSNLNDRAKNITGMIRAIKKLSDKRKDFEFHIVGDDPQRDSLEDLSRQYDLLNTVIFFHGGKKQHEVAELMRGSDLFILFSNYETISCVMQEALASGLPVVASSIGALKENLKEGMGLFVPPRDEDALCNAIMHAMDNRNGFDKEWLHLYAKEKFSNTAIADKFDTVYKRIFEKAS